MHTLHACALRMDSRLLMRIVLAQYIDALRLGHLDHFEEIEEDSGDWWFPTMDRGAGAALHFAAEHGQVKSFKCRILLMQLSASSHPSGVSARVSTDSDAEEVLSLDIQPLVLASNSIDAAHLPAPGLHLESIQQVTLAAMHCSQSV